jgi:hypothetical protein
MPADLVTPAALRALAAELDGRVDALRRCPCPLREHHGRVADELADIAASWRSRAIRMEQAAATRTPGRERHR